MSINKLFRFISFLFFLFIIQTNVTLAYDSRSLCPGQPVSFSYAANSISSCDNIISPGYGPYSIDTINYNGRFDFIAKSYGTTFEFRCYDRAPTPNLSTQSLELIIRPPSECTTPIAELSITSPQLSSAGNVPLTLTHNTVAGVGSCEVVDNLGNILLNKSTPAPVSPYVINVSKAPGNYTFTSKCWSGLNGSGNEGLPDSVSYTVCAVGNIINSSGVCAAVSGGSGIPNPVANFTLSKYNVGQNETYSATLSSTGAASCEIKLNGTVIYPSTF